MQIAETIQFILHRRMKISKKQYNRICPLCKINNIIYLSYEGFRKARKNNSVCRKCSSIKIKNSKLGSLPWNKGIPMSGKSKLKLSKSLKGKIPWSKGKKFDINYIKKLQNSHLGSVSGMKGKLHSSETREKIRNTIIEKLKTRGISVKYNPIACQFIDQLNKKMGWNLQHALNGDEIIMCGYSLDGYDIEKNIIFEYDEPKHHQIKQKNKDKVREKNLFNYFLKKQQNLSFWRYDERYQKLYEVFL